MQIQTIRFDYATIRLIMIIFDIVMAIGLILWAIYYYKHRSEYRVKREKQSQQIANLNAEYQIWKQIHPIQYKTLVIIECVIFGSILITGIWRLITGEILIS